MIPNAPTQTPPPPPPAPVAVMTIDNAAGAWRTVIRWVAWIGLANGACTLASYVISSFGSGAVTTIYSGLSSIFRGASLAEVLRGIYGALFLTLAVLLLLGSVGVIARRRWGPALMLAYAIGTVPNAVLYTAWISVNFYSSPRMSPAYPLTILMLALEAARSLTFPAIVVLALRMSRKHASTAPLHAAFEPLPAAPAVQP